MINGSYFVLPIRENSLWVKEGLVVLGASFLIALSSLISIPLLFTPVPLVIHTQVLLLLSAILGSKRASLAVSLYLAQGALGFPVFAGGTSGIPVLAGPTGGYLFGFLVAAFVTGWIAERLKQRSSVKLFGSMAVGNLIILCMGTAWLSQFLGLRAAFMCGFVPFILAASLKLMIVTLIAKKINHLNEEILQ